MYRLIIENTAYKKLYDATNLVKKVEFETEIVGKPGTLKFDLVKDDTISYFEGNPVRFYKDKIPLFYGFIFSKKRKSDQIINTTCYDQLRYLKNKDSFIFINKTATQIIQTVADVFNLKIGNLENTEYIIPELIMDNKTGLDTIYTSLDRTLIATRNMYVLYDNFGQLELKHVNKLRTNLVIGDKSLAKDYEYSTSIDENVANKVKIINDNKETGRREVYIVQDSLNIAKWGILQEFDTAKEGENKAQIAQKAENILKNKNKLNRKLSIPCLGDWRIKAGSGIYVNIANLGDISYKRYFIVKRVKHKIKEGIHTMDIDVYMV